MLKFVLHDAIGYVRHNVREFSLNALRLLPQLPQLSPYDVSIDPAMYRSMYSTLPLLLLLLFLLQVNLALKENEFVFNFPVDGIIRSYETNQLGSNSPCEDSRTEASLLLRNGFICGVFDGHAGAACGQVVSKRLLRYISAGTLPRQVLKEQLKLGCTSQSFLKCHNDNVDFVSEIRPIYERSFQQYISKLSEEPQREVGEELQHAFIQLDQDLAREALDANDARTMGVALSGEHRVEI